MLLVSIDTLFSTQECTYSLRIREGTKALDELYKIADSWSIIDLKMGDSTDEKVCKAGGVPGCLKVKLNLMPLGFLLSVESKKSQAGIDTMNSDQFRSSTRTTTSSCTASTKSERLFFLRMKKIEEVYGTAWLIFNCYVTY
uniref:Kinase n=1 Tax=Globodera pallida TaxID=36090 RepID=A0A183BQW2_GLOPA